MYSGVEPFVAHDERGVALQWRFRVLRRRVWLVASAAPVAVSRTSPCCVYWPLLCPASSRSRLVYVFLLVSHRKCVNIFFIIENTIYNIYYYNNFGTYSLHRSISAIRLFADYFPTSRLGEMSTDTPSEMCTVNIDRSLLFVSFL